MASEIGMPQAQDMKANPQIQEFAADLMSSRDELAAALGAASQSEQVRGANKLENGSSRNVDMLMHIPVEVKVVLGSATMPVAGLVKLGRGAIIPLDRRVGDPVDVVVNGRVIARGEVVVLDEGSSRFGISLTEVVGNASVS